MPARGPDVSHPLSITSTTDKELVVPPYSTAIVEGNFRHADILLGLAIELLDGDKLFLEEEEQGCEDGLILSGESSPLEDGIVMIPGSDKEVTTLHSRASRRHAHAKWALRHRRTNLLGSTECHRLSLLVRLMIRRSNLRRWDYLC